MVVTVYSPTKGVPRHRVVAFSALVLGVVSVLAGWMTVQRRGDPLGPRLRPEGWNISFRTPRHWVAGTPIPSAVFTVLPFHGRLKNGTLTDLAVWAFSDRIVPEPQELCAFVLRQYAPLDANSLNENDQPAISKLIGDREGIEVIGAAGSTVVRAVTIDKAIGFAVSLNVEHAAIDDTIYRLFDLTCQSVQHFGS